FDDHGAERTPPAAKRRDENAAAVRRRPDKLRRVEPETAGRNRVRLGLYARVPGSVRAVGGPCQCQLPGAAIVNPDRYPPGPEEVVQLGAEGFERAAQTERGGN